MNASLLVSTRDQGIPGVNYYYTNREQWNISLEELAMVGIIDDQTYVHQDLITPLLWVINRLHPRGYGICIKDAFRSPETYTLVRAKVAVQRGEDETAHLFNMKDMPHATGRAIDIGLIDLASNQELGLRDRQADGPDADFLNFYRGRNDSQACIFQERQDILHAAMLEAGFVFGSKREVWHFELAE